VKAPEGSYVSRPGQLVLLPGAAAAVARLNRAGVRAVLVTNQRWLARPGAVPADYTATHRRLVDLLAAHGARLDAAYHCPHERGTCDCRKPAPGMLTRAVAELGIDPDRSVIIGDAESDLAAGRAAGVGTILVDGGQINGAQINGAQINGAQINGAQIDGAQIDGALPGHPDADLVVPDLRSAVQRLLEPARP
jgi:D-glycero-D-manno-heptose 1,7-bisphosphate phosphatase